MSTARYYYYQLKRLIRPPLEAELASSGGLPSTALVWDTSNGLVWGAGNYLTWG